MEFYNFDILILFLGGLLPLILTVVISLIKHDTKRNIERTKIEQGAQNQTEEIIEEKLRNTGFGKMNVFQEFIKWGIQPLVIMAFLFSATHGGFAIMLITFLLLILVLLHEFKFSVESIDNWIYQVFIILLWIGLFLTFSYFDNQKSNTNQEEQKTYIENTTTHNIG
ncbi:hypothetical protein KUL113_47970 [Tenacibaculum sp. KUL113]|nr:hypothetical protein KUL113_47970 [Tenacibaculum sp. KUL113]